MAALFDRLPDAPVLDPAKRESKVMGKLDMPNIVRPVAHPGLALVGDAAISSDPMFGVGCGFALQSAEWLAEALGPALGGGASSVDGAVADYARRHRRGLAAHEKFCSDYSSGRKFNLAERLLYRGAARDRQLAGRMAELGGRWIQPQELITPGTVARVVRVNLSPLQAPQRPAPRSSSNECAYERGDAVPCGLMARIGRITVNGLGSPLLEAGRSRPARRSCSCTATPAPRRTGADCSMRRARSPARSPSTCPGSAKRTSRAPSTTRCPHTPTSSAAHCPSWGSIASISWCTTSVVPSACSGACRTRMPGPAW